MAELRRADLGIWLINLDRDTGRLARMQQQLDAMGLAYTRFAAIDGRAQADELAARVDAAAYARNMGQNVTPGHVGCYASHVAVWEQVAQAPQPVALILEDNVVFHDDFRYPHKSEWTVAFVDYPCVCARGSDQDTIGYYKVFSAHQDGRTPRLGGR